MRRDTRQGHPVMDNQNIRTIGNRGPATLENYHFIEKISHFDREEVPERVVHARGAGAFGYFEAYGKVGDEPVEKYTRAKVFSGCWEENTTYGSLLYSGRGEGFAGNSTRPKRLCGEIVYGRWQLGSGRQQPENFLYP